MSKVEIMLSVSVIEPNSQLAS